MKAYGIPSWSRLALVEAANGSPVGLQGSRQIPQLGGVRRGSIAVVAAVAFPFPFCEILEISECRELRG